MDKVARSLILLVALGAWPFTVFADTQVCRIANLNGFDSPAAKAREVLGPPTSSLSSIKVFMTVHNGQLYVQTNYVVPGYGFPSKLAIDEKHPLEEIILNLITDDPEKLSPKELTRITRENVELFVDRFHLEQSQFSDMDLSEATKVTWLPLEVSYSKKTHREATMSPRVLASAPPAVGTDTASPSAQNGATRKIEPGELAGERDNGNKAPPKGLYEAAIEILLSNTLGRFLLLLAAAAGGLLTIWNTLPESTKTSMIGRFAKVKPSPQATLPRTETDEGQAKD
jgi:hypothetical protein